MSYHRRPKTTQERRQWGSLVEWIKEWPQLPLRRQRRSFKTLVDAWDDLNKSNENHNTWKRHRRTRYRVIRCP